MEILAQRDVHNAIQRGCNRRTADSNQGMDSKSGGGEEFVI
ncbi:hypothetical protein [Sodalis sp. dw_96]|nr:hypothetical protein [Sodalis sp. dw_96]